MKIFIIHSLGQTEMAIKAGEKLESDGHTVYIPGRDTPQGDHLDGEDILQHNFNGLRGCDEAHCYWDGTSLGTIFDAGMAYALRIPIRFKYVKRTWTEFACGICKDEGTLERIKDGTKSEG